MNKQLFVNNATSQLSGTLPQGGTTLVCTTGQGSRFPTPTDGDFYYLTLYTKDVYTVEQNVEVIKVTSRVGDVLTIVRDIENITGQAGGFAYNGSIDTVYIEMRWTAGCVDALVQISDARLTDARTPTNHSHTKAEVGLGNVDNTSDIDKPVSIAQDLADAAVLSAAALDATTKANARQAPIGTIVGLAKGNGANALTAAVAGTDYVSPTGTETLTNKTLTGYTETVYALAGTVITEANGAIQTKTLAANTTFTETLTNGQSVILGVTSGAYTITWPSITWAKVGGSGVAPTLVSTGVNWVVLWKVDGVLCGLFLGTT